MNKIELEDIPLERLQKMAAAGAEVLECYRVLQKADANIVGEILREQGTFYEWDHYPKGDIFDNETHSQYYYHAHRSETGEHGHFHTFVRRDGMPENIQPIAQTGEEEWPTGDDIICHVIAISMDKYGLPTHLFTTNRWVTGENWFNGSDVVALADRFIIDHAGPSWPVNRWLTAMVALFQPQIAALVEARDAAIAAHRDGHPDIDTFEDRDFEVTSIAKIDVDDQIARVNQALEAGG